jgi:hypothetical protein
VVVTIPAAVADRSAVQHTATLLINLLARSADYVSAVHLDGGDATLRDRVVPAAITTARTLTGALRDIAHAVGDDAVPLVDDPPADAVHLILGPGAAPPDAWRVLGTGWTGIVTRHEIADTTDSTLPFGSYVAACLAAAAVCWTIRGKQWHGTHLQLSAWDLTAAAEPASDAAGPDTVDVALDAVLAGVGAVGTALLLTLWACGTVSGTITTADDDVVDDSNRNRCVLFFADHIDTKKTDVIGGTFPPDKLTIKPVHGRAETLLTATTHLISAVDSPESRGALQQRYPASIIQASTDNIRVELLRCDPTVPTPCLRCYNPPRPIRSDDQMRRDFAALDGEQLADRAAQLDTDVATLQDWIDTGRCSEVTGRLLTQFRTDPDEHAFSIGFASALAGTLLAAQAVKDQLLRDGTVAAEDAVLHGATARARFPLLDLGSRIAGPGLYGRQPDCPACDAAAPAAAIWRTRYTG